MAGGLAMDAPSVGFGQNDAFAYQARAFLEEVAGIDEAESLPRCATFDEGVHNMELLAAVAESAPQQRKEGHAMKLGVYNAILHDRPLPEALKVIADLGLTGIEINSGGFLPAVHIPTFDDILVSDTARDDYLGIFEGTGVSIAGLNCNGNPLHPNTTIGDKHAEDIRRSIRLANRLGQHRVVTMSGLPGGEPGATRSTGSSTPGTPPPWTCWTTSGASPPRSGRKPTAWPPTSTSRSPSSCTRRTWCSTPPTCTS